jgi:hypothetical protein
MNVEDPVTGHVEEGGRDDPPEVGKDPKGRLELADRGGRLRSSDPLRLEERETEPARFEGNRHRRGAAPPARAPVGWRHDADEDQRAERREPLEGRDGKGSGTEEECPDRPEGRR